MKQGPASAPAQSHPSTTSPPTRPPPPPPPPRRGQQLIEGQRSRLAEQGADESLLPDVAEAADGNAADATDELEEYSVDETDGIMGGQQKLEEDEEEMSMDKDEPNRAIEEEDDLHADIDEREQKGEEASVMDEEVPWEDREPGWAENEVGDEEEEEDLDDEKVKRKMMDELDNLRRACQADGEVQPDEEKVKKDDEGNDAVIRPVSRPKGKPQPPDRPPTQWQRAQGKRAAPEDQGYSRGSASKRKWTEHDDWQDDYKGDKGKSYKPNATRNTAWKDDMSGMPWKNPEKKGKTAPWSSHLR